MQPPHHQGVDLHSVACPSGLGLPVSLEFPQGFLHLLLASDPTEISPLLRTLSLLDLPESGEIEVLGSPTAHLDDDARAAFRSENFGFLFTSPFLLHSLSVLENVAMPLLKISQSKTDDARIRTNQLLEFTQTAHLAFSPVDLLTRDQQFRVALARALVNHPPFLIVENLDASLPPPLLDEFSKLIRSIPLHFKTTVIASASLSFPTEKSDRLVILHRGVVTHNSTPIQGPDA
ncbi:MAG: ATP-binding cassette domain-containing protein [Verrucomicrobiota bacterium]